MSRTHRVGIKLGRDATMPIKATPGSAGYDLHATKDLVLEKGMPPIKVDLDFATVFSPTIAPLILPRSGFGSKGMFIANTIGLIDSDYRGNWSLTIGLHDWGVGKMTIDKGTRIGQMVFVQLADVILKPVATLPDSERGTGGHGSTGEK